MLGYKLMIKLLRKPARRYNLMIKLIPGLVITSCQDTRETNKNQILSFHPHFSGVYSFLYSLFDNKNIVIITYSPQTNWFPTNWYLDYKITYSSWRNVFLSRFIYLLMSSLIVFLAVWATQLRATRRVRWSTAPKRHFWSFGACRWARVICRASC